MLAKGTGWLGKFGKVLKVLIAREDVLVAGLFDLVEGARLLIQPQNTRPF
jgi:hypothetical protein